MSVKENNKGKRIVGFRLLGKYHSVDTWKELLITVSEILYDKHKLDFYDKVKGLHGSKLTYFSINPKGMREPRQIGDSIIYVETKWDANAMKTICIKLMGCFGYSDRDLTIVKL